MSNPNKKYEKPTTPQCDTKDVAPKSPNHVFNTEAEVYKDAEKCGMGTNKPLDLKDNSPKSNS